MVVSSREAGRNMVNTHNFGARWCNFGAQGSNFGAFWRATLWMVYFISTVSKFTSTFGNFTTIKSNLANCSTLIVKLHTNDSQFLQQARNLPNSDRKLQKTTLKRRLETSQPLAPPHRGNNPRSRSWQGNHIFTIGGGVDSLKRERERRW
jgi:hypothetical protein